MSKRNAKLYIADITDSIKKIELYTKDLTFEKFVKDDRTVDAVIKNLFVIGEAVKNIPKEIKDEHRDIPWTKIAGMRNRIVHEYFGLSEIILWKTIEDDIPEFKKQIRKIKLDKNGTKKLL